MNETNNLDIHERIARIEERSMVIQERLISIEKNGLRDIQQKITDIYEKLSHRRPTWNVLWIISGLASASFAMLMELLRR